MARDTLPLLATSQLLGHLFGDSRTDRRLALRRAFDHGEETLGARRRTLATGVGGPREHRRRSAAALVPALLIP